MIMCNFTVVAEAKIIKKAHLGFISKTLTVGKTAKIKVKGNNIQSIKYKSLNRKIATVTRRGKVKAIKQGKAKIRVVVKYKKSRNLKNIKKRILIATIKVKQVSNHSYNNTTNSNSNYDITPSTHIGNTGGRSPIELPDIEI